MYKIRLTDSVCIQKYALLKPEVEQDYDDGVPYEQAAAEASHLLAVTVNHQLTQIAARMTDKQKQEALSDVSVDNRFKEIIKETLK